MRDCVPSFSTGESKHGSTRDLPLRQLFANRWVWPVQEVSMLSRAGSFFGSFLAPALFAAGSVLLSGSVVAQAPPVRGSVPGHTAGTPHQEPCWQVAGISKSAMEERRSILQSAHSQVEAVCADSSLTAQQRNEKIRAIHQQTKQQADAIVTPSQMESLKACQSSRSAAHPPSVAHHSGGGGGGPCGQLPGSAGSNGTPGSPGSKPQPENDVEN